MRHYGSLVIPHVGHEVVVAFLEGDPDRPLIIGSVPNALTMPPMELPRGKDTRRSSATMATTGSSCRAKAGTNF